MRILGETLERKDGGDVQQYREYNRKWVAFIQTSKHFGYLVHTLFYFIIISEPMASNYLAKRKRRTIKNDKTAFPPVYSYIFIHTVCKPLITQTKTTVLE